MIANGNALFSHYGGSGIDSDGYVQFDYRITRQKTSGDTTEYVKEGVTGALCGGFNSPTFVLEDISSATQGYTYTYKLKVQMTYHNGYAHTMRLINPTLALTVLKK